ncbi:MAG TPA: serine hydrolase [Candidatus Baltobacteraceae bacterium]|nr:serine hydrolase [Candidatus Baltobacteraceae bacterium]
MLTDALFREAAAQAGLEPLAVIIRRLDARAAGVEIAPDAAFYPASMIKTPLAAAVLALACDGELRLDGRCEVTPANMTVNDKPSPLQPGYESSVAELIDLMLTRSDNVATNMLIDLAGRERATTIVQERLGLRGTAFYRKLSGSLPLISDPQWDGTHLNTHPPIDAARLFELIARSQLPFAWMLRSVLARQEWNNKLSGGLHSGDNFAHKTGDTDEVTHDGGILETAQGKSYVVVAYSGMESTDANNARFGPFMRALRNVL